MLDKNIKEIPSPEVEEILSSTRQAMNSFEPVSIDQIKGRPRPNCQTDSHGNTNSDKLTPEKMAEFKYATSNGTSKST